MRTFVTMLKFFNFLQKHKKNYRIDTAFLFCLQPEQRRRRVPKTQTHQLCSNVIGHSESYNNAESRPTLDGKVQIEDEIMRHGHFVESTRASFNHSRRFVLANAAL